MTQVENVYANALYVLASEEGLEQELLGEVKSLREIFKENPAFIKLLASYRLSKQERCGVLDNSLRGKVHPYVLNFLKILTEKGYISHAVNCFGQYEELYNEAHGILSVTAYSAAAMTKEQMDKLSGKLAKLTGKTIMLSNEIDESCLGGVRLSYEGKQVDGTVRNRLDSIEKLLKTTVL